MQTAWWALTYQTLGPIDCQSHFPHLCLDLVLMETVPSMPLS